MSNANASDTIPEGYFKNTFGEIQPLPSNKKGGFIRNPLVKRASDVDSGLIEEARKYKSAEDFVDGVFGAEKGNTYKNVPKDLIDNEYLDYLDNEIYFKQKIDKGTVESWKERIKKGERPPIKIDDTNGRFELGDGYHRYQAYKELGFEKIPVFYKSELKLLFDKIKKE